MAVQLIEKPLREWQQPEVALRIRDYESAGSLKADIRRIVYDRGSRNLHLVSLTVQGDKLLLKFMSSSEREMYRLSEVCSYYT